MGENNIVKDIESRIQNLTKAPKAYGENLQVGYYKEGGFFNLHYDYAVDPASPYISRVLTVLIYLNDVEEGGETHLPKLGIAIIPKKGRAVLWYNFKNLKLPDSKTRNLTKFPKKLKPHPDVLHAGSPVRKGEKWIMTKWIHSKPIKDINFQV